MEALFTWIAYGLAGLFFCACTVAWWEHLGRERRGPEELDWEPPLHGLLKVDVELDAPEPGDAQERQQALGGALSRMTETRHRQPWIDTAPMILPGREQAPDPAETTASIGEVPEAAQAAQAAALVQGPEHTSRDRPGSGRRSLDKAAAG